MDSCKYNQPMPRPATGKTRPATGKTPVRNLRVPDAIWQPALAKAHAEGTTITEVITRYLTRYLSSPSKAEEEDPTAMDDLVELLNARLDNDERLIREYQRYMAERAAAAGSYELVTPPGWKPGEPFDVDRQLAEVEAKRRIIRAHGQPHECLTLTGSGERSVVDGKPWELWEPTHTDDHGPCLVLRCLALPTTIPTISKNGRHDRDHLGEQ